MRRVIGRLLLTAAAALPLSVAVWGQPAEGAVGSGLGTAVMKCMHFKDAMIITPGLSHTPTDQTIAAHGRVYGCNKAGGGAKFSAQLSAIGATCSHRRFEGTAEFRWANGRTSTASLTFVPAPVEPKKVEVIGIVTNGFFEGLLLHSWVRTTDTFKGSGPGCTASNLLKRVEFTNSQSLQLFTPVTTTTTVPQEPTTSPTTSGPVVTQGSVSPPSTVRQVVTRRPVARPTAPRNLAFTGNNYGGALLGLESLIVGGGIWALGGGRRPGRTAKRRRGARTWLCVTMPDDRF
jgi:hypothetical protein